MLTVKITKKHIDLAKKARKENKTLIYNNPVTFALDEQQGFENVGCWDFFCQICDAAYMLPPEAKEFMTKFFNNEKLKPIQFQLNYNVDLYKEIPLV